MKIHLKPGDECECGNPAEIIKGNVKMCRRCDEIERRMYSAKGGRHSRVVARVFAIQRNMRAPAIEPYHFHAPSGV